MFITKSCKSIWSKKFGLAFNTAKVIYEKSCKVSQNAEIEISTSSMNWRIMFSSTFPPGREKSTATAKFKANLYNDIKQSV